MRKFLTATAIVLFAAPVVAHDFWIQPARFALDTPGTVPLSLFVGHGQDRGRWGVSASHVRVFKTRGPDGLVDRRKQLTLGAGSSDAVVRLAEPGAYVFGLQSRWSESSLPAERFNDYVDKEGITPIEQFREQNGLTLEDGREVYSRRAKAIVQVGKIDEASVARVTRPVGLKLEMVPGRHPGTLSSGDELSVRVLYKGQPLNGALVKLNDLAQDDTAVAMQRTGADGRTVFTIPRSAKWQLNTIWSEPFANRARADFDTTFSSLTFATGR